MVILLATVITYGQTDNEPAKIDIGLSYSYLRLAKVNYSGVTSSINYNLKTNLSLGTEFSYFEPTSLPRGLAVFIFVPANTPITTISLPERVYSLLAGPKFTYRDKSRISMFAQGLVGFYRADQQSITFLRGNQTKGSFTESRFATKIGGGLDLRINKKVSLRLIEANYTFLKDHTNGGIILPSKNLFISKQENAAQLSAGVIFHLGKK